MTLAEFCCFFPNAGTLDMSWSFWDYAMLVRSSEFFLLLLLEIVKGDEYIRFGLEELLA
jgi:hypothetical protein